MSIHDRATVLTQSAAFDRFVGSPTQISIIGLVLAAALDENMSLQCVLAGETFVTVFARKRFNGQMDPLMSLEVVIAIETLRALITLERPIGRRSRHAMRRLVGAIQVL